MSQIITKGLLSNKVVTQGFFGRASAMAVGLLCISISAIIPEISITSIKPDISITSIKPEISITDGGNCSD